MSEMIKLYICSMSGMHGCDGCLHDNPHVCTEEPCTEESYCECVEENVRCEVMSEKSNSCK